MKVKKSNSPLEEKNEVAIQARKAIRSGSVTSGKQSNPPRPSSSQTPFAINKISDIRKASKILMTDLINKEGRFTVAESRVFKDMAELFFKAEENIVTRRTMRQLARDTKKNRQEQ